MEYFTEGKGNAAWFKLGGRYLIKQRLEHMMIQFVNQDNVEKILIEVSGKLNPGKTATRDYYFLPYHRNGKCF
jgi:hypothetical protein